MSSGAVFKQKLSPTKSRKDFLEVALGKISLTAMKPETITISGKDSHKNTKSLMNLRGVILRPIR